MLPSCPIAVRVLPYVRNLPQVGTNPAFRAASTSPRSVLRSAADVVARVLGGSTSVRRRLERADVDKTVHEFRVEQVLWGIVGFAAAAAFGVLRMLGGSVSVVGSLMLCAIAFVIGVLARDSHLTSQVRAREPHHRRVPHGGRAARPGGRRR